MTRASCIKPVVGGLLVIVGVLFAVLPKDWIEETFGAEPDAGSGVLELALVLVLVPIVVGLVLLAHAFLSHRHQQVERATTIED